MKPQLNLITYASLLAKHETETIQRAHHELLEGLEQHYEVNVLFAENVSEMPADGIVVVFVATGGTEGMVVAD